MSRYSDIVLALRPQFYHALDERTGLADLSGFGRNATAAGGVTVGGFADSPIRGEGRCTDLDGVNDAVTVPWVGRNGLSNHVTNPRFLVDTAQWSVGPVTYVNYDGASNLTAKAGWAPPPIGLGPYRRDTFGYLNMYNIGTQYTGARVLCDPNITFATGVQYTGVVYIYYLTGPTAINVLLGDLTGGADFGSATPTLATSGWTRCTVQWTPTGNRTNVGLVVRNHNAIGSAQVVWVTDASVYQGAASANQDFFDGEFPGRGSQSMASYGTPPGPISGWLGTPHQSGSRLGYPFTVAGWAYRDGTTQDAFFGTDAANATTFQAVNASSNAQFWPDGAVGSAIFTAGLPTGKWFHWALVSVDSGYGGGPGTVNRAVLMYLNGALVAQMAPSSNAALNWRAATQLQLGTDNGANPFDGKMAHVCGFDRALSGPEVSLLADPDPDLLVPRQLRP